MQDTLDLVVVANRLPVHRVDDGNVTVWETSPGGLVSALVPTLLGGRVAWVGWTGDVGPSGPRFRHEGMTLVPVGLDASEIRGFYTGFSNGTLWPLYHAFQSRRADDSHHVDVVHRRCRDASAGGRPQL